MMTFLGFFAGWLVTSLILGLLMGRWLRGSSAQDDADGAETANCIRFLSAHHPEIMRDLGLS